MAMDSNSAGRDDGSMTACELTPPDTQSRVSAPRISCTPAANCTVTDADRAIRERLYRAASSGDLALCRSVVDDPQFVAKTHFEGWLSAMDVAIAHPHVVSLFLDRGLVKADESGARHLIAAAKGNRVDTCEALMRRWCSASAASAASAALSIAAQEGFLTLCASLLKLGGANVNTASERRPSALYCAASRGRGDVCELLLDNGADVELGTRCGQTPLHVAARVGYPRVCEILLAAGAKQSQHPPQGMPERGKVGPDDADTHSSDVEVEASGHATGTPLCVAVKESRWDVCAVLLKYGATHDCDRSGRTPLSHAAVRSCEGCRTLLKYGATHDADDRGKTPLDHATEARRDDICKILVQHIVSC